MAGIMQQPNIPKQNVPIQYDSFNLPFIMYEGFF